MSISEGFNVFGANITGNTAKYGTFASFRSNIRDAEISFHLKDAYVHDNHAEIAGGKFFIFDPLQIAILEDNAYGHNTAGKYGNNLAGFTNKITTLDVRYVYPEQPFKVVFERKDRFGNTVTQEVEPDLDFTNVTLRMEGGKTFVIINNQQTQHQHQQPTQPTTTNNQQPTQQHNMQTTTNILRFLTHVGSSQGNATFFNGTAVFGPIAVTSHLIGSSFEMVYTARNYTLIPPDTFTILLAPVCSPGHQLVR